jgi:hypothetical protein
MKYQKRKYKNDIGRIQNMNYTEIGDYYTCKNNKKLKVKKIIQRKSKTGYISKKTIYTCEIVVTVFTKANA